jgi:hypothetical protein
MTKKIVKIEEIFMFYYLKPWKSWQVVHFHSYECQRIQTKNPFDKILSVSFDLRPLKLNTYYVRRNQFFKELLKGLI